MECMTLIAVVGAVVRFISSFSPRVASAADEAAN